MKTANHKNIGLSDNQLGRTNVDRCLDGMQKCSNIKAIGLNKANTYKNIIIVFRKFHTKQIYENDYYLWIHCTNIDLHRHHLDHFYIKWIATDIDSQNCVLKSVLETIMTFHKCIDIYNYFILLGLTIFEIHYILILFLILRYLFNC